MTRKNRVISIAISAILAFAVLCTSGVTLALNLTSNRSTAVAKTAGINLSATVANLRASTAKSANEGDEGAIKDDYSDNYYTYEQWIKSDANNIFNDNGGSVKLETVKNSSGKDEQLITISNIVPGDKVEFDIEVTSQSNVAFDYCAELYVEAEQGQKLVNQLDFKSSSFGLSRVDLSDRTDPAVNDGDFAQVIVGDTKKVSASKSEVETAHVSVLLPVTATEGQGETVHLRYRVRGSQNLQEQDTVAEVEVDGTRYKFTNLYTKDSEDLGAVEFAKLNDVDTVYIVGSNIVEEGEVVIDDAISFVGAADGEGKYPTLNGAHVTVENGAAVTFTNVNFDGTSYIDVSGAGRLTMNNCTADVAPIKLFDKITRKTVQDSAFIVSGTSLTPVRLDLSDNTIVSNNGGAAISLNSPLSDGSLISGNTFGSQEKRFDGEAALTFNGAYKANSTGSNDRPVVTVSQNTVYADRAFSLGGNAGSQAYIVSSVSNVAHGIANNVFVKGVKDSQGTALASFVDNGSTIDSNELTIANVSDQALVLGGINVTLNDVNLISAGHVSLANINETNFYQLFADNTDNTTIILYRNGVAINVND